MTDAIVSPVSRTINACQRLEKAMLHERAVYADMMRHCVMIATVCVVGSTVMVLSMWAALVSMPLLFWVTFRLGRIMVWLQTAQKKVQSALDDRKRMLDIAFKDELALVMGPFADQPQRMN
jgi:hypothetical protein